MSHTTECMKSDSFEWPNSEQRAIEQIQILMTEALVLVVASFEKFTFVECDASDVEIRALLSQDRRPVDYSNEQPSNRY